MTTASDASRFVSDLAPRLERELERLSDAGFVQAFSDPVLTYRHRIVLGLRRTAEQQAAVQGYRYEDTFIVTTSGDRSFGGPLDLGPVDGELRAAGYFVEAKRINPRREYRAEIPRGDAGRAAALMARTLELLGATDPGAVDVQTYADG
jgi:hypothetical protein